MEVYPLADQYALKFREAKGTGTFDWPDWCYLPVAASYAIISDEAGRQGLPMSIAATDIGNLAVLLSWRVTKGIYKFDTDILKSLWDVQLNKEIPTEVLFNLPEWCCYIDLEGFGPAQGLDIVGFFVSLEYDTNTHEPEIRIALASQGEKEPGITTIPFHIHSERTIVDMLESSLAFAKKHAPGGISDFFCDRDISKAGELYSPFFSLILYLCSANRDIVGPLKTRKMRQTKNPKKQKRQLPVEYRVGTALGSAIRRAQIKDLNHEIGRTGGTKGPHIRKAHYCLYWTGPGRKVPIVKLIPSLPINIGDEPILPIVRHIK